MSSPGTRPPDPIQQYRQALREHQRAAGLSGPMLAVLVASLQRKHRVGHPPEGHAWIGHDQDGQYSEQQLALELAGGQWLPRQELLLVIAWEYAFQTGEPEMVVVARLEAMRVDAALHMSALMRRESLRRAAERARPRGRLTGLPRPLTVRGELAVVRHERDQARATAQRAEAHRERAQSAASTARRERDEARGQLAALRDDEGRLHGDLSARSNAAERPLVPGADGDVVDKLVEDLRRGTFRLSGPSRRATHYPLERKVVLHVCAAALTTGLLLPDGEQTWIPGRSSIMLAEPLILLTLSLGVLELLPLAIVAASWPEHLPLWFGYAAGLLTGAVLAFTPRVRRVLSPLLFTAAAITATGLTLASTGATTNPGDIATTMLLAVPAAGIVTALSWARPDERFYDQVAHSQANELHPPNPALIQRLTRSRG